MTWPQLRTLAVIVGPLFGAAVMIAWRMRETMRPVSVPRIVIPPVAMSTGLAMFVVPATRIPLAWAAAALAVGAVVLAIPVTRTSRLIRQGDQVLMQRSPAFLAVLVGLVAVRLALRSYLEHVLPLPQTAAIFYLLALGMIVRWRGGMLAAYLALRGRPPEPPPGCPAA